MTPHHLRQLIDRLRRLQDATHNGRPALLPEGAISRLDHTERRLLEALRRDNTGTPQPDGYPRGGQPDGGEDAAQSSTEAAALQRLTPATHDRHHELTHLAAGHLDQAVDHIVRLLGALEAIDRLAHQQRQDPSGSCLICGRHVEGTSIDRLRRGMCHTDFTAWIRAGRPDLTEFQRQRRTTAA